MIVVGVPRFISAYLAVGADPRIGVPVSNLRSPIPVPCALSSIPKSGPCGEYLSDDGRPLFVFGQLTFIFFGSQHYPGPTALAISSSLKSATSQRMGRLINECFGSLCPFIDVNITTPSGDKVAIALHHEGGVNIMGVVP